MLKVEALTKRFGGLLAVDNYSLHIQKGKLVGLIGPNGAGKTTIFNLITGVLKPDAGRITFNGHDITGKSPDKIARYGIARTFQNVRLFKELSVIDNLRIAFHTRLNYSLVDAFLSLRRFRSGEKTFLEVSDKFLKMLEIQEFKDKKAADLPYGVQKKVEMARAVISNPTLLLLDEPVAGLNPNETAEVIEFIQKIKEMFNLTILLIEHDMKVVMGICERIQVINKGEIIAEGTPQEIQNNPQVIEAYLGRKRRIA